MTDFQPGWYPDPDDPAARRYWDGASWSAPLRADAACSPPPAAPTSDGPSRRGWWKPLLTVLVVALLAGGFVVYWFAIRTEDMSVRGTLTIEGSKDSGAYQVEPADKIGNTACHGTGGYSDITQGVQVTVTGADGKTVGTGSLEDGIYIDGTDACIFGFEVKVPDDQDRYGITISHRGTIQFSKSQMKAGPGLTLGGD